MEDAVMEYMKPLAVHQLKMVSNISLGHQTLIEAEINPKYVDIEVSLRKWARQTFGEYMYLLN